MSDSYTNTGTFDCIVAGGGHAGCEAAVALARLGHNVLLISGNLDRLGYLSCNPAIGGLAAAVWSCVENTCHQPNERSSITAAIKDAQVFTHILMNSAHV